MTLRLTVHRTAWLDHVHTTAQAYGAALAPVVKGNGYGLGRGVLHPVAAGLNADPTVCVGTVHELDHLADTTRPVVLTPTLTAPPLSRPEATLTIGALAHVDALRAAGWRGDVLVKLVSSMRRYGTTPAELPALLEQAERAGLRVLGYAIHLPLAGTDDERRAEVAHWLPALPADGLPLWLSHLQPATFHALAAAHPERPLRIRVGTGLWHGSPRGDFLHLGATVLAVHSVSAGDQVGYRHATGPTDGTLVAVSCGSSHGVAPLEHADPALRSPFHFGRHRMILLERPHMHTSLCLVPTGNPCPAVGDLVDVQQPLITVHPDEVVWLP